MYTYILWILCKFYVANELQQNGMRREEKFANWPLCFCQINDIKIGAMKSKTTKSQQMKQWLDNGPE